MNFGFLHRFLVATTVVVGGSSRGSSSRVGPLDDRPVATERAVSAQWAAAFSQGVGEMPFLPKWSWSSRTDA